MAKKLKGIYDGCNMFLPTTDVLVFGVLAPVNLFWQLSHARARFSRRAEASPECILCTSEVPTWVNSLGVAHELSLLGFTAAVAPASHLPGGGVHARSSVNGDAMTYHP